MNCKPGDLAVVVYDPDGRYEGCFLKVLGDSGLRYDGSVYWELEPLSPALQAARLDNVCDDYLRPIRDPGDDARDETLEWLPVPTKETA